MEADGSLEDALADAQQRAEAALKAAEAVGRELRRARLSAANGQVRELRRALDAAAAGTGDLTGLATEAAGRFTFDVGGYLGSGGYAGELRRMAADAGVALYEEDDRLICYPSLVRILAGDEALEIDRRRERRLRPSVVVELLRHARERPPRFHPEAFLDALRRAYDLAIASGRRRPDAVVRVTEVWSVLTLLPGTAREYTKPEFARDLYLLDQQKCLTSAGDSRVLHFAASTGTRSGGVLTAVAESGQLQRYWGISFRAASPS